MEVMAVNNILTLAGELLSSGVVIALLFYWQRRRQEEAKADKAYAEAIKVELDNARAVSEEWKFLYGKKEDVVVDRDNKIEEQRKEIERLWHVIFDLQEKYHECKLKLQEAEYHKCVVRDCPHRQPPQEILRTYAASKTGSDANVTVGKGGEKGQ